MGKFNFSEEFKRDAEAQIVDRGYSAAEVSQRLGVSLLSLYSRRVIGWSLQSRPTTELVLQTLLAAVWRRKPKHRVVVHSDQGSQFTSMDWSSFLKAHNLEHSMSRRGNCHDNAVVESFFNLLKRERVRRRVYKTRDKARRDMFDYI